MTVTSAGWEEMTGGLPRETSAARVATEKPHLSLMRQYTPSPHCEIKGLDRRVTDQEYERVLAHFEALGLSGFTQEKEAADASYTPPFDLTGV